MDRQEEGRDGFPAPAPQMPARIALAVCGMVAGPAGLLSLEALGGGRFCSGFSDLGLREEYVQVLMPLGLRCCTPKQGPEE